MRSLMTTQNQNSYREQILKEVYTRLTWKMKYGKEYPVRFALRKSKPVNPTTGPKVTLPPVVKAPEKKKNKKDEAPVLQHALSEAPLMRPASPQTTETLYNGLSKEGKGRSQYLTRRMQKMPEERFDYPLLSSWEYGWRLGDYGHEYKSPFNGRSAVIRNTFYTKNGIFNIPSATDLLG